MEGEVHLDRICLAGNNYPIFNQAAKCNLTVQKVFRATGVLQPQPAIHVWCLQVFPSFLPMSQTHFYFHGENPCLKLATPSLINAPISWLRVQVKA